jgi:hypothetical protein
MDIITKMYLTNLWQRFKKLFYLISLMSILFLISCASKGDWATVADWDEFDISEFPNQTEYPDAGAVILFDAGIAEIADAGEIDFTYFERHRVVKIFNTSGYSHANVSIAYNENSEVEAIEARTISPDGKISILDEDNIFDITLYPNFVFFSDQRAKIFTFPAVENGCILEYKYRLAVQGETLIHSWYFQNSIPTELSRFSMKAPSQWKIDFQLYNIKIESEFHQIPSVNKSTRTWEARNLQPIPSEIAMPSVRDIGARVAISPIGFNTWSDVARWYHNLSESQMVTDESIKEVALNLTADAETEEEKVKRLFEWVRDRVRYIAVSIGIGGFKPHRSDEVLNNRYGDCKDMTTLLCSAAKAVDIPIHQVLISTQPNGHVDTSLVSPFQFNHAIAYYPMQNDSGLWLDATKKGSPFGQLPWYNQDRLALVIDEEGKGTFKRTTTHLERDNRISIQWKVNLDAELNAAIEGRNRYWGAPAAEIRQGLMKLNEKQCKQWIEGYLTSQCSGIDLESFSISNIDTVSDPLTFAYKFRSGLFTSHTENIAVINLASILSMELPDYFLEKDRETQVEFRHGNTYQLSLVLNLPLGWRVQKPSRNDSISSPYGNTIWNWETRDNVFNVKHEYQLSGHRISQESYADYQNFLKAINENDLMPAVLLKN